MSDVGYFPCNQLRSMFYSFIAVLSLTLMGATAELCNGYLLCESGRNRSLIAMAALSSLLALGNAVVSALDVQEKILEFSLAVLLFVTNTAAMGLAISPKTSVVTSALANMHSPSELFVIANLYLLVSSWSDGSPKEKKEALLQGSVPMQQSIPMQHVHVSQAVPVIPQVAVASQSPTTP